MGFPEELGQSAAADKEDICPHVNMANPSKHTAKSQPKLNNDDDNNTNHESPPMQKELETEQGDRHSTSTHSFKSTSSHSPRRPSVPPPLSFTPWSKKTSIIICTFGLLFFDLALPCLLYYTLLTYTSLSLAVNLGISCASLGLGELLELPLRGYRLYKHGHEYAPLGQDPTAKWAFDFLFWWYLLATVIGIVPYVLSTSLDEPILWLFLFTPGFLAGFAVLTAAVSLVPFRLPFRVSSDARGERCKPFTYYVIEDFIAVDAGQGRVYREELMARWNASPVFRTLLWEVNLWWVVGGIVFTGALAGITWGCEFNVAYGLSFGVLFIWIGVWSAATWWWVKVRLRKEREWFERRNNNNIEGDTEKERDMV
jgi:hypothetical protein